PHLRALARHVVTQHFGAPRGGIEQPEQDLQQGALARTVGADQADDAGLQFQVERVQCERAGIPLRQRARCNKGHVPKGTPSTPITALTVYRYSTERAATCDLYPTANGFLQLALPQAGELLQVASRRPSPSIMDGLRELVQVDAVGQRLERGLQRQSPGLVAI